MSSKKDHGASSGSTADLHQKLNPEDGAAALRDAALLEHPSYLELQKKLDETEAKVQENWDRFLHQQAEMENLKRRTERDVTSAHKYALDKFVPDLLPVIDSMERSMQISSEEHAVNAVLEGISLTLKLFYDTLAKHGVEQLNPEGEAFNPELHQAVSVQESAGTKPGIVLNVLQKGYTLNGRLLRPALVVVSK